MNKWFISDTHFSHTNIIRYTGRPFQSVHEMDEQLIVNWNTHVAPEVWDYKPVPEKTIVALLDRADPILEPQSLTAF